MAATDFFTIEVWTSRGLVTYYVLFVIHLSTRSVHIAGVTTAPNGAFMKQVARNLTDVSDGFLLNKAFLIMDRDAKYTEDFRDSLDREGVKPVRCPVRAPNCNAVRRTVCTFYKRGMFGPHDSFQRGISSPGTQRVCYTTSVRLNCM